MKVVIIGLGGLGEHLATMLFQEPRHELVLIDMEEDRCALLSDKTDALVLHGDGTDPDILAKAGLGDADALVACTGVDAINTVIAMLGKEFGVPKVAVKLKDTALVAACNQIGVQHISMPKIAAAAEIRDALYGVPDIDLSSLALGGMRVVEVPVSADVGALASGPLPRGTLVLSVRRGHDVFFPHADLTLQKGDTLLLLLDRAVTAEAVRKSLGER